MMMLAQKQGVSWRWRAAAAMMHVAASKTPGLQLYVTELEMSDGAEAMDATTDGARPQVSEAAWGQFSLSWTVAVVRHLGSDETTGRPRTVVLLASMMGRLPAWGSQAAHYSGPRPGWTWPKNSSGVLEPKEHRILASVPVRDPAALQLDNTWRLAHREQARKSTMRYQLEHPRLDS